MSAKHESGPAPSSTKSLIRLFENKLKTKSKRNLEALERNGMMYKGHVMANLGDMIRSIKKAPLSNIERDKALQELLVHIVDMEERIEELNKEYNGFARWYDGFMKNLNELEKADMLANANMNMASSTTRNTKQTHGPSRIYKIYDNLGKVPTKGRYKVSK